MNWKPHTEHPDHAPASVVIAAHHEGWPYIHGLYLWNGKSFRDEETDRKPSINEFYWVLESEVLEGLPK